VNVISSVKLGILKQSVVIGRFQNLNYDDSGGHGRMTHITMLTHPGNSRKYNDRYFEYCRFSGATAQSDIF